MGRQGQFCPFRRQGDAAAMTGHQLRAQKGFQLPEVLAYGRLRDRELFGGAADVAVPRHGLEGRRETRGGRVCGMPILNQEMMFGLNIRISYI